MMQKFHGEFENRLRLVSSYFVTTALYENKVTIVVGASNCHRLELPTVYDNYPVLVCENSVKLAKGQKMLRDCYSVKLKVGADIGRTQNYDHHYGTLGGFVRVGEEIMAMTCHHVVQNNCEFSQPSNRSIRIIGSQTRLAHRLAELQQDFSAGSSESLGIDEIVDHCRFDYQLLKIKPSRLPEQPMNRIKWNSAHCSIKPPLYDLNDEKTSIKLVEQGIHFSKHGAASRDMTGTLINSSRSDCIIRPEGCETYTLEFAIKPTFSEEFARIGDSGAWVFSHEKNEGLTLVGMISAISVMTPCLTFITPISDIVRHFKSRTNQEIYFLD